MLDPLRRTARRLASRFCRPAVLLLLVLAQAATAFGFPVVQSRTGRAGPCGSGACGCESACGSPDGCCCTPAPAPAPKPAPVSASCRSCGNQPGSCCCTEDEPEPEPACPKCRAKPKAPESAPAADPTPTVKWVPAWQARQCHGDGPLGLFADLPAVPPAVPARPTFAPLPAGTIGATDSRFLSLSSVPDEPPPRCG